MSRQMYGNIYVNMTSFISATCEKNKELSGN